MKETEQEQTHADLPHFWQFVKEVQRRHDRNQDNATKRRKSQNETK